MRTYSRITRLCLFLVCSCTVSSLALSQQPFDLDTTFRTEIDTWYVSSILPVANGKVIASGIMRFPNETSDKRLVRLHNNGQRDATFNNSGLGGGFLRPWTDRFYASTPHTVRRILADGNQDPSFIGMNLGPYFSSLQGGDYHVYPDGRILMSGVHRLEDTLRGFDGYYCLIWFSNTGYLDTTKTHRTCAGSLDFFTELPNGQFIGSGSTSIWDGQQASNIIRFNADGSLDNTFQANVYWGEAYSFLPLQDGRVYVGGEFKIEGIADTLNLVRFLPDGSLDPTFNNSIRIRYSDPLYPNNPPRGIVRTIYPLSANQIIVTGNFGSVDDVARGAIAMLDTSGILLDDYFSGDGCGAYIYQATPFSTQSYARVIGGIKPSADGSYYIYGAYHGYDDGTTNDTNQRMVSRLHGLDVGFAEHTAQDRLLSVYPNPGQNGFSVELPKTFSAKELTIFDAQGRVVHSRSVLQRSTSVNINNLHLSPGVYLVSLYGGDGARLSTQWLNQ